VICRTNHPTRSRPCERRRRGGAAFNLHCPDGPPRAARELRVRLADLNRIEKALPRRSPTCAPNGERYMAVTERDLERAEKAAWRHCATPVMPCRRTYDRRRSRVVVALNTGVELDLSDAARRGADGRLARQPGDIGNQPGGTRPALAAPWMPISMCRRWLQGVFGSKSLDGAPSSAPKRSLAHRRQGPASRRNGRKGGRPRKAANRIGNGRGGRCAHALLLTRNCHGSSGQSLFACKRAFASISPWAAIHSR